MKELARRIDEYLKKFEADPEINKRCEKYKTTPYWNAGAYYGGGSRVSVTYVSYQGACSLTRAQAETYLAWLDAGNAGYHWRAEMAARG